MADITVQQQLRAFRQFMTSDPKSLVHALVTGWDPALQQLVFDAIRSAQTIEPGKPGNIPRPEERGPSGIEFVDEIWKQQDVEYVLDMLTKPGEYGIDRATWRHLEQRVFPALVLLFNLETIRYGDAVQLAEFWAEFDEYDAGKEKA